MQQKLFILILIYTINMSIKLSIKELKDLLKLNAQSKRAKEVKRDWERQYKTRIYDQHPRI